VNGEVDTSIGTPSAEEITKSLKASNRGKALGIDNIQAALMKVNIDSTTRELHRLFQLMRTKRSRLTDSEISSLTCPRKMIWKNVTTGEESH